MKSTKDSCETALPVVKMAVSKQGTATEDSQGKGKTTKVKKTQRFNVSGPLLLNFIGFAMASAVVAIYS